MIPSAHTVMADRSRLTSVSALTLLPPCLSVPLAFILRDARTREGQSSATASPAAARNAGLAPITAVSVGSSAITAAMVAISVPVPVAVGSGATSMGDMDDVLVVVDAKADTVGEGRAKLDAGGRGLEDDLGCAGSGRGCGYFASSTGPAGKGGGGMYVQPMGVTGGEVTAIGVGNGTTWSPLGDGDGGGKEKSPANVPFEAYVLVDVDVVVVVVVVVVEGGELLSAFLV